VNAAKHHVVRAVRATSTDTRKMAAAAAASSKDDAMNDKNDVMATTILRDTILL
jgi:prophage DNA circulation protein